ncbi:cell division protein FtsW [bacterium endosymbiont of Pedicinus badii]|uniref:cell division protein FtsW n=1 Tax=bacterium endosymbiont of Pedicinus badii TaxID=1719126 RepID=UPI0009BC4B9F|nr:cell division protein FtsW [bacterium endosymbiont of Pedicinus badii]OQM34219.1 hypothetical protein AOQ89_02705 [bacterium endosymbiont of Pedicinus badii]
MKNNQFYDRCLLFLFLGIILFGFIMVFSASISIGEKLLNDPFYFFKKSLVHLVLILVLSILVLSTEIRFWEKYGNSLFILTIIMLVIVLLKGSSIRGSIRWISFGIIKIQPAEILKLTLLVYISNYLKKKSKEIKKNFWDFFKPILVIMIISILLLAQPDFGTVIILFLTVLSVVFLAGVNLRQFFFTIILGLLILICLVFLKPYRIKRISSFLNPWNDPFGDGYQLTQSLMAFGRGSFFGQGLGNSIQKLEYLPESHTDFILAVIAEELGYIGSSLVVFIIFFIFIKSLSIGKKSVQIRRKFSGFLAFSIGICLAYQSIINIGVVIGFLPTKGLTLPFISYGGSSLVIFSLHIMLLLRIDFENNLKQTQVFLVEKNEKK